MQIDELLTYFQGVKPLSGKDHFQVLCPCHNDHKPSLDIKAGNKGILMSCPACGADGKQVMQAIGLDVKELFYEQHNNFSSRIKPPSVDYNYSDKLKKSRFYIWDSKEQNYKKCFCWWHKNNGEKWEKGLPKDENGRSITPPLYKQDNLTAAKNGKTVYIVEGEKDVDTLTDKLNMLAVCSPHGASQSKDIGKKWSKSYNELFKNLKVAVIADNDEAGHLLASYIAKELSPYAASVKIIDLCEEWDKLPPKGDITDIYENETPNKGKTIAETVQFKLEALTDYTKPYERKPQAMPIPDEPKTLQKHKICLPDFDYETVKHYKADDIGVSELFAELVKGFMCYVPEEKVFYIYNGVIWEKDVVKENLKAGKVLISFVRTVQKLIPPKPSGKPNEWTDEEIEQEKINAAFRNQYTSLGNANGRERVLKDIKKLLYKSRNSFDTQPELLNCKNCTYNLETGKTQPHSADDFLTKCVNADYDPTAVNDRFDKFIDEICESDEERKAALQAALGYSLIGSTPEECFFIAYGKTTRNGKGTLFDLVLDVLGDYGLQIDFDTIARSGTKDASRATPDLARLVGIRYVLANEPQKGVCFNEGLLKQLTGSDDITARPLYGSVIEFKPTFKIYITANNLPAVSDDTLFTSDRIRILPFNKHFSAAERDTSLKAALRKGNGRAAVLNWLIEGYRMYSANGFIETQQSKATLQQYRKDNDYIQEFIDECLILYSQDDIHAPKAKITEIQGEYNYWCRSSNIKPLGKRNFCEELEKHGINIITHNKQKAIKADIKDKYLTSVD